MSRSLSPEENQRVCDALRELLDGYATQGDLSEALVIEGKAVSQQSVSNALANKTVGIRFARAVAMLMGITLEELLGGFRGNRAEVQRYNELLGWGEAAAEVLEEELVPAYAVAEAGKGLVSYPVKRVDPTLVYDEAMRWMKHAPFELRKAVEKAEVQAVLAREAKSAKRRGLARSDDLPKGLNGAGELPDAPWGPPGRRRA
jgi:hypothetical protein